MRKFIHELYSQMKASLDEAASLSSNLLQRAEQSCEIVQQALLQLKNHVLSVSFKDKTEEIWFFKEAKPMFLRELIFFIELYHMELNLPAGTIEEQQNYWKKMMEGLQLFFMRNRMLYAYYRTEKTMYDELYFLRDNNQEGMPLLPKYSLDIDTHFSTLNSFYFSKIQAYERLSEHIEQVLYKLTHPDIHVSLSNNRPCLWTDSKTALIELAYAIHARGSVNQGKGDVKSVIASLEQIFQVQVGNFYRAFQNMRIRKKNRTTYLDTLRENLERYMDESDLDFS